MIKCKLEVYYYEVNIAKVTFSVAIFGQLFHLGQTWLAWIEWSLVPQHFGPDFWLFLCVALLEIWLTKRKFITLILFLFVYFIFIICFFMLILY